MKYCLKYQKYNEKLMQKADEIVINYDSSDVTFVDFLEKYKNKRIIIEIPDIESFKETKEIEKIIAIRHAHPEYNFSLVFSAYDKDFMNVLKEKNINYFTSILINNWDVLNGICDAGVSDVYIVEDLAFDLERIEKFVHNKNIKVRVFPNVAQSQWNDSPGLKKFFIRPEDLKLYEQYVDVCEFFGNIEQEETLLDIYKNDKYWYGDLSEIIIGLNDTIDSRYVIPWFGERRTRCRKNCMKGSNCRTCEAIVKFSKTLEDKKIINDFSKQ